MRVVAAVLLALAVPLSAAADAAASGAAVAEETPQGGAAGGAEQGLFEKTLRQDVDGASYYELLAWCRQLGLEDAGNRQALQARLRTHYELGVRAAPASVRPRVEIVAARDTEYFTLQPVGQSYVELRGGVVVKVRDKDGTSTHTIEADTLLYNQTTGEMTATGNARYVLRGASKEKDQTFEGQSLSFDTNTLVGVFYDGTIKRERSVGGRTLDFTFRGNTISRLANDTIVLEDGTMTSSTAADPNYLVRSRKAWILADGEWAILGATLEVGHVPLFYLPFFFYPGDELVFHPSMEFRAREGTVLQTTTYLIGQRKPQTDSLSLLQLSEEPGSGYQRVPRGMYLTVDPAKRVPVANADRSLTLMADVYSRLGAMVGIEAKFPPEYSGRVSLGVSRSLFLDAATGGYTPYWSDPDLGYVSVWNHSDIAGLVVPVRFGVDSTLRIQRGLFSANGSVETYSDPYYPSDFYNRSDRMKWDTLLGTGTGTPTSAVASTKSSLAWTANAAANVASLLKTPVVSELAVRSLELGAFIGSRTVDLTGDARTAVDPARTFYYPVSFRAPTLTLGFRGTILSLPTRAAAAASAPAPATPSAGAPAGGTPAATGSPAPRENPGKGVRWPWDETPSDTNAPTEESGGAPRREAALALPTAKPDISVALPGSSSTLQITYSASPRIAVEYPFATAAWAAPADVDFATSSTNVAAQSDVRLGLDVGLFDRLVAIAGELQATGSLRTRYAGTSPPAAAEWARQQLSDYQASKLTLAERATLTLQPLLGVESLQGSNIAYTFGWQFLGTAYDSLLDGAPVYVTVAGKLDRDAVTAHSVTANLVYKPDLVSQTLTLTAVLPPEYMSFRGQLAFSVWQLTTRLGLGVTQTATDWVPDPIVATETFQPVTWFGVTQEAQFDAQKSALTRLATTLKLDGLSVVFTALRMAPVTPLGVATGAPETFLPSQLQMQYALGSQKALLWKNRIKIEGDVRMGWNWNLQRFTQNELTFNVSLSISVYRFLTLSFAAESYNNRMYQYIPGYPEAIGGTWVNPLFDLVSSFNFFNIDDRYRSAFKIRRLSITAVHQMDDWDLRIDYQGQPTLTTSAGVRQYQWNRTLTISVDWRPLPLIHGRAHADSSGFSYGG